MDDCFQLGVPERERFAHLIQIGVLIINPGQAFLA
jgi:hypothetical protein